MKITKRQLKRIIKEELKKTIKESDFGSSIDADELRGLADDLSGSGDQSGDIDNILSILGDAAAELNDKFNSAACSVGMDISTMAQKTGKSIEELSKLITRGPDYHYWVDVDNERGEVVVSDPRSV